MKLNLSTISASTWANFCIVVVYTVGVVGFAIPSMRPLFTLLVPVNLIASAVILFAYHSNFTYRFVATTTAIAVLGFLIECVGVNTGLIFGSYSYGPTLGFAFMGTPFLIGVNWLLLTYICWDLAARFINATWGKIIAASALMLIYDFVLEPVAIATNMWHWSGGNIPLQNYAAWYAIAAGMFSIFALTKQQFSNPISATLFVAQFLFFLILNFVLVV